MTLIHAVPRSLNTELQELGKTLAAELNKQAAEKIPSYAMAGMLYASSNGMGESIMLSVPNALVRGTFAAISEIGVELPPGADDKLFNAHITVIRPDELALIGGPSKVTERGRQFSYRLGGLESVEPDGWPNIAKCWMLRVHSPDLQALRRSYGLSSLPKNGTYDFHITVAVRRKAVLGRNDTSKVV